MLHRDGVLLGLYEFFWCVNGVYEGIYRILIGVVIFWQVFDLCFTDLLQGFVSLIAVLVRVVQLVIQGVVPQSVWCRHSNILCF